jgi:hypothetical protein
MTSMTAGCLAATVIEEEVLSGMTGAYLAWRSESDVLGC